MCINTADHKEHKDSNYWVKHIKDVWTKNNCTVCRMTALDPPKMHSIGIDAGQRSKLIYQVKHGSFALLALFTTSV